MSSVSKTRRRSRNNVSPSSTPSGRSSLGGAALTACAPFASGTTCVSFLFLVLADIQGSESYNPSNKARILFDLMSHTHSGDSGAGDHGEDGIQSFVVQHKCGQRCIQMGLEKLGETEEEED
ncbi:hypothetical protein B0H11DRAFT_2280972 [Mycena galericulata]|nr:hypothetical protein B0H11DRAFT_2280972 [Mycena galericulata]